MRSDIHARMRAALIIAAVAAPIGCQGDRAQSAGKPAQQAQNQQTAQNQPQAQPTPAKGQTTATVDQVKEQPANFYGKTITVAGKVDELLTESAFELEGTGWAFNDNITVLTKSPAQLARAAVAGKDELVVSGTVRPFVVTEVERELGWDLSPEIEVRLKERPILIADAIRRVEDEGGWTAEGGEKRGPINSLVTIVTSLDLRALAGQHVDLGRERVQSVMGRGLWIGPSHMSQMFVLPTEMPKDLQPGDMVQVSGTLRQVPKNAATDWGLPKEMAGTVQQEALFLDGATVKELPAEQAPGAQTPAATAEGR